MNQMINLEINNQTNKRINKKSLQLLLKKIIKQEKLTIPLNISLAVVDNKHIRKINKIYRAKDKPTNVLSFCFKDDNFPQTDDNQDLLGEIIISAQYVAKDAVKNKVSFTKEFNKVFVHGVYHLLGYVHDTDKSAQKMENKENLILK